MITSQSRKRTIPSRRENKRPSDGSCASRQGTGPASKAKALDRLSDVIASFGGSWSFRVNLKAELEIRHLHEKTDHLISRRWQRLAEIQQLQIETMHEFICAVTSKKSNPI